MSFYSTISPDIINRYNVVGPRYTSYPTVPIWENGDFGGTYEDFLKREGQNPAPFSLYIHLPFCSRLCTFCGCNQFITNNKTLPEQYLDSIDAELERTSQLMGTRKTIKQLHLGGGTPTHLSVDQLQRLMAMIEKRFDVDRTGEIALEAHPRVTTDEQLTALRELGFGRISFGVQDLDPDVQKAINRNQTLEMTQRTFEKSRELGFESINIDLVYGLPKQTVATFERTMELVHEMGPDRMAIYSFAYIPNMFKGHERAIKTTDLPSAEEKVEIYLSSIRFFTEHDYRMIGMDHYARLGDEMATSQADGTLHRNFMGYTTLKGLSQIGMGVSAISDFGDGYFQHDKDLHSYMKRVNEGDLAVIRRMQLNKDDVLRRELIESLMCQCRVDFNALGKKHDIDYESYFANEIGAMATFVEEGLVTYAGGVLELTELGVLFMRNVAMPFDRYLADRSRKFNFSKTV